MKSLHLHLLALSIVCSSAIVMLILITPDIHGWGGDWAQYLWQTRSLLDGTIQNFIERNRFLIEHSAYGVGPIQYPWGYPLFLAPIYYIAGFQIFYFKWINLTAYVVFLIILYRGFIEKGPSNMALVLLVIFAFHPYFVASVNLILSDTTFLLFSTAALLWIDRFSRNIRPIITRIADQFLLGVLIGIAISIRINGLLLILVLIYGQWLALPKRQGFDKKLIFTLIRQNYLTYVGTLIVLIGIAIAFPSVDTAHIQQLKKINAAQIIQNIIYYVRVPTEFFGGSPWLYILSLPFFVYGWYRQYRDERIFVSYFLLTFGLYCVWPGQQGLRFLMPIIFIFVYFVLIGARHILMILNRTNLNYRIIKIIVISLLLAIYFFSMGYGYYKFWSNRIYREGPFSEKAQEMFSFIKNNTNPQDVVVFRDPRTMAFLTDRASILVNRADQLDLANYVVLDKSVGEDQSQINSQQLTSVNHLFYQVFANDQFKILKIK